MLRRRSCTLAFQRLIATWLRKLLSLPLHWAPTCFALDSLLLGTVPALGRLTGFPGSCCRCLLWEPASVIPALWLLPGFKLPILQGATCFPLLCSLRACYGLSSPLVACRPFPSTSACCRAVSCFLLCAAACSPAFSSGKVR